MRIGLETKIFNKWLTRVLAGFLVCLLGQAETKQTNFIAKGGSAIFQNVNLHELKILSLEGHGTVNLVFEPHSSKDASNAQPNREIFVYENRWAILPKLDSTFNLKITCQVEADCKLTAELLETEADRSFLPATSQNHLSLDFPPGFKGDVSFLVLLKALYKSSSATFSGKNQPKLRFETFAQQAGVGVSEGYFTRDSRFDMRVFEKDKQTPISKNTTQLGMNLYATLESRDKDYHWAESAVYRVVLSAQSITTSMFSLELVPEVQVLDLSELHKTYSEVRVVADQVYPGTAVKYEVILPRFTSAQFDLVPVEGNPDIFINPDENLGWEPSKYQYKSERDLRESITITETELKLNNKTAKKLYVVVNSKVESTYTLNLELRPQNYSEIGTRGMRPNTFYSGTVLNNQVINFVLEFYVVIPEVISSYISLKARTGNPDLYIKDCEELSTCEFTLEEIDKLVKQDKERIKSGKTDTSSGMYFKYSDSLQNSDDLYFEMNMVPYGSAKYTETTGNQLPNFANKLKTSKHNRICVGVVGHANTLSKVSEYTLIAKTRGGHGVVSEYRSEFIYLGPSDEKFIIYSPLHLPDEVQGIIAKFDVSHGDASVYFSTANKFPSSKSHDMALEIDNDQQALESMTRYMHIPRSKLSSQVYFGINAKKQTLVNMLITYWTPEPKAGESIRLIPGVPIITKVTTLDQFTVKLFKNAENARNKDAYIKVVSQFGVLRVCAARIKNPSDSVTKADCEYDSLDELLHIPVDRIDSDQSDWIIFVEPAGSKYGSILPMLHQDSSVEYKIELLTSRSISPLEGSGKVTEGIVTDGEGVIHYHDFWLEQNTQYVWVHIQSIASSNLFATASFNKTEVYRIANIGPYGTYGGMSEGSNQGYTFVFKSQEIRKFCEVPKAEYQYPPRNLQQDHKDGPSGLPEIRPAVVCKVFIRVSAGFQTQDLSTLTSKQYRVLFAKDTDTIHLQPGKVYTLPAPLKSRMLITSETKNYQNGITASVKSLSSNLIGSITAKLVSIKDGSEKFEVKPIMQKIRFYQTLILPTESFKNAPKDSEDLKATTWVSLERNSELQPSYEQVPSDMDSPVHPHSSISIIFESQVNILELGTPIQGIAHQGKLFHLT